VAEGGEEDVADVGEGDVIAAFAEGEDFGGEDDGLCAARGGAEADVFSRDLGRIGRVGMGVEGEAADVIFDVAGDGDGADEFFHRDDLIGVDDGDGGWGLGAGGAVEDSEEVVELGGFDGNFEGEAIELGFGERVGAFHFDGVLGGEDEEGFGHFVGGFGDGDGLLGHGFEEGGLGFGGGAVDFVGEDEVAEDGAGLELPVALAAVVGGDDGGADDVSGHEVGCELDAGELEV